MDAEIAEREFRRFYLGGASLPIGLGRHGQIVAIEPARSDADGAAVLCVRFARTDGAHIDIELLRGDGPAFARSSALRVRARDVCEEPVARLVRAFTRHLGRVETEKGSPPIDLLFPNGSSRDRLDPSRREHRLELIVFPTDACNLRCTYCIVPFGKAQLSAEHVARAFAIADRGELDFMGVAFLGGEPTLGWACIEDVTEKMTARWKRPGLSIVTNGTLLTPERVRFMADHSFGVTFSIDGLESSHATHRLAKGSGETAIARELFRRSLEGLRAMRTVSTDVKANMVVTPTTVDHLTDGARFLLGERLASLTISPSVGLEWGDDGLRRLRRALEGYAEIVLEYLRDQPDADRARWRAVLQWEIRRSWYFMGNGIFNPHTRRIVLAPDGRLFSDLYNDATAALLHLGHVDEIETFAELPKLDRTVPQAMFSARAWSPRVLDDVRSLSRHLLDVLIALDREGFRGEPGAAELVGYLPESSDAGPDATRASSVDALLATAVE
jgi:molybdenum cofactor biosynthesis enzyme MoaA